MNRLRRFWMSLDRSPWVVWAAMFSLAVILAVAMCGCTYSSARTAVSTAIAAPITESREEGLSEKAHRLEGELAAVNADLRYSQDQTVRWIANLSAAVCALGCITCFIASVFLPVMKTRLLIGGVAFAAGIAVSLTVRQAIPYLPWIGLAIIAIGIGATLPTFIKATKSYAEKAP